MQDDGECGRYRLGEMDRRKKMSGVLCHKKVSARTKGSVYKIKISKTSNIACYGEQ